MGQTLEEFALELRTHMHERVDHWWPVDPGAGDARRRMGRLNQGALADATHIDRNRLGRILSGKQAPEAHQLSALLRVAGTPEPEREAWAARRAALVSTTPARSSRHEIVLDAPSDDFEIDGLFMVNTWGASAPLTSEHSNVCQTGDLDEEQLSPALRRTWASVRERIPAGAVCVVSRVGELDWHETADQSDYEVEVRRGPYSLALAQRELLAAPAVRQRARDLLNDYDLASFVSEFPGCKIAVNVQVATADGFLVALRRSRLVHNYKAQWALSINETMQAADEASEQEGLFELTYRGLSEELHLHRDDVKTVSIEWFGACLDCGDFYAFANARTSVVSGDLPGLRSRAHSRREHDTMVFLDVERIIETDFRGPGPDGNRWLHHAPLAAQLGVEMLL